MERMQFEVTDKNGNKIKCEVIATYHHDEDNKDYIVYTDNTFDENKKLKIYYALYEMIDNKIKIMMAKTNEEKRVGLELIKAIMEEIEKVNKN